MFGAHLSISGGLHNALLAAEKLDMETVQIFSKNQQQWRCPPLCDDVVVNWKTHAKRLKFKRTVSHDSYLINLAATNETFWRQSIDLFVEELRRCAMLEIPFLVAHPGAHMDAGEDKGIRKIARSLDEIHARVPDDGVITCLEATAGQGSSIGHRLEHLGEIISLVKAPQRLGVCLDTAHLFAAGYDFRGPKKYAAFRKQLERTIGMRRIKVLHLNDSKKDLGSRVDRHEHIGHGKIGISGFAPFVRDKAFAKVPKILETPKEKHPTAADADRANLETLRAMLD